MLAKPAALSSKGFDLKEQGVNFEGLLRDLDSLETQTLNEEREKIELYFTKIEGTLVFG